MKNQLAVQMKNYEKITRDEFMEFIRDEKMLNTLNDFDRKEVFFSVLPLRSSIDKELLDELLFHYEVDNISIVQLENDMQGM